MFLRRLFPSSRLLAPLTVLASSLFIGCSVSKSPQGVVVKGRILNQGAPLELVRPDVGLGMIQITLMPQNADGVGRIGAQADKDGYFETRGTGSGLIPMPYKLAVEHWKTGVGTKDELENRFSPENTPIEIEVPASAVGKTHDLGVIELSKYSKP